jgi:proteasome lid subunit RPN8/RPN11
MPGDDDFSLAAPLPHLPVPLPRPQPPTFIVGCKDQGGTPPFELYFHLQALATILHHLQGLGDHERGGLLIGQAALDEHGLWLGVVDALPATAALSERLSLTFTHAAWNQMLADKDERYPEQPVAGWYHTHPGLGVFLSQPDLFIHQHFFTQPTDVALVIDPHTFAWTPFVWRGEQLQAAGRFFLYAEYDYDAAPLAAALSDAPPVREAWDEVLEVWLED